MQKTKNYGFNKPETTDLYSVGDFNDNMDAIDEKLKEVQENAGDSLPKNEGVATNLTIGEHDDLGGDAGVKFVDTDGTEQGILSMMNNEFYRTHPDGEQWAMIDSENYGEHIDLNVIGASPTNHNQAASTITAGTLGGQVKANKTAQATLTTAQLRDAVFVAEASAPAVGSTADTSKYPEGCLIVLVEAV